MPDAPPPPYLFLGLCLALYLTRFGYGYGMSDQDEFLPSLLHRMDPLLLGNDWFVQTQQAAFSVRTYFTLLLHGLALVLPLPLAVFFLYVVSWVGIAYGLFRLAERLSGRRLAGFIAVPALLLATPQWTLGGNDFAHSMLAPSMAAWALGLQGLAASMEDRRVAASVWMGVATWMQALVGLHLALLGAIVALLSPGRPIGTTARFIGVYALVAAPALGPLFYQQFAAEAMPDVDLYYIMARFRIPHHYLFDSFSERSLVRFGLLAIGGLGGWFLARPFVDPARLRKVIVVLAAIVLIDMGAYVATERLHLLGIAKLQLFMLTVPAKLLLVTGGAAAVAWRLPARVARTVQRMLEGSIWQASALGLLLVGVGCLHLAGINVLSQRIHPLSQRSSPSAAMEAWVRAFTPANAVFATPPSLSSFRTGAQRAIVVNHKAFPYRDADIAIWFERLLDMAPIVLPERTDTTLTTRLDAAYDALTPADLAVRAERYGFVYAVRTSPWADSLLHPVAPGVDPPRLVHVSPPWHLYQLAGDAP